MSNSSLSDKTLEIIRNAQKSLAPKPKRGERPSLPIRLVARRRTQQTRASFDHS